MMTNCPDNLGTGWQNVKRGVDRIFGMVWINIRGLDSWIGHLD